MRTNVPYVIALLILALFEGAAVYGTAHWADSATVSLNMPDGYILLNGNEILEGKVPTGTHNPEL